jgi:hypothetical protein
MSQIEEKNISGSKGPKKEKKQIIKRPNLWLFGYIAF